MSGTEDLLGILAFGLLVGLRHAFEADHVMAVATLAAHEKPRDALRQGVVWGLGHTLTLLVVGGVVLCADAWIPTRVASSLEMAVGVMLLVLGADLIRRVVGERWHLHAHEHGAGRRHVHLHRHPGPAHDPARHDHAHPRALPLRALLVGMMHGLAGTAALLVLTLQTVASPLLGLAYIGVFGLGSIAGMALSSLCVAVPLRTSPLRAGVPRRAVGAAIGACTVGLGVFTLYDAGLAVVGLG